MKTCPNCGNDGVVLASIPCPCCQGHGINEIDALRALATWVRDNTKSRSKPARYVVGILNEIAKAQGLPLLPMPKPLTQREIIKLIQRVK